MKDNLYGFTIYLDVYLTSINVLFGSKEKLYAWGRKQQNGTKLDFEGGEFEGVTFVVKNNTYVYIKNKTNLSVVTHELVHALYKELSPRNLPFNEENNEVFAYGMSWLIEKYLQTLKKKDYFVLDKKNKWVKVKK